MICQVLVVRQRAQALAVRALVLQAVALAPVSDQVVVVRQDVAEIQAPAPIRVDPVPFQSMQLPPEPSTEILDVLPGGEQVIDQRLTAFVVAAGQRGREGRQGPPGPDGGSTLQRVAQGALGGHRMVYSVDSERVAYADSAVMINRINTLGLTLNAADDGADVNVQRSGAVEFSGWNWAPGAVFLGSNGMLTQTLPVGSLFSLIVGYAQDPTNLLLDIGVAITLEA